MRRQRNMDQMKKTDQNSRKRTKKMEISNLSDAEFIIRMLKKLVRTSTT